MFVRKEPAGHSVWPVYRQPGPNIIIRMKVLLTGATGFLGFRLLEELSRHKGISGVIASGRTIRPALSVRDPKVSYRLGDLADAEFADSLTGQADVIIHAAARSSPWGRYRDFRVDNTLATRHLLQAAQRHGTDRIIYVSSSSVYVNGNDRYDVRESDPLPEKFINHYARTKRESELEVIHSGLPYIILRPRALIGRGDTVIMPRLIHAFKKGKLIRIGRSDPLVDLTPVENMVAATISALFVSPNAMNQVYNIANGRPVLLWESVGKIMGMLGYDFNAGKRIPVRAAMAMARIMELKSMLTGGAEPPLTVYGVLTLARSFTMNISVARQQLGYEPRVTADEAIAEFVHWYSGQAWKQLH